MRLQRGSRGPALPDPSSVQRSTARRSAVAFADYDQLISAIRDRLDVLNISQRILEEIAEIPDGAARKYLSPTRVKRLTIESLLKITSAVGIRVRPVLVADEKLLRKMKPLLRADAVAYKAHPHRRAPIGPATLARMRPAVLSEMGRLGARARNEAIPGNALDAVADGGACSLGGSRRRHRSAARPAGRRQLRPRTARELENHAGWYILVCGCAGSIQAPPKLIWVGGTTKNETSAWANEQRPAQPPVLAPGGLSWCDRVEEGPHPGRPIMCPHEHDEASRSGETGDQLSPDRGPTYCLVDRWSLMSFLLQPQ